MPPTPKKKKTSGDEAKTATVYATETFVAFQHPDDVDPTRIDPGNFKLLVGGEEADLSGWTATFLPHLRTTVLVPPEGRTIFEFGPGSYAS